jgi:hypothetical protein
MEDIMTEKEVTKREVKSAIGKIVKKRKNKRACIEHFRQVWKRDKEMLRYIDKLEKKYTSLFE